MEIVINWDWISFIIGFFTAVSVGFWSLLFIAWSQYRKQQKAKTAGMDSVERMFAAWGGRDNSSTK